MIPIEISPRTRPSAQRRRASEALESDSGASLAPSGKDYQPMLEMNFVFIS